MKALSIAELKLIQGGRTKGERCLDSFPVTDFNSGVNALLVAPVTCSVVQVVDTLYHPWRLLF